MLDVMMTEEQPAALEPDYAVSVWERPSARLTVLTAVLVGFGLVMVASIAAGEVFGTSLLKRLVLTGVGIGAFVVGARVRYQWWRRHSWALLGMAAVGLLLVLVPGIGMRINGARRWIDVGLPVGIQPSEFAKVALCIWVAAHCERNIGRMRHPLHGFVIPLGVVGLVCGLILLEPDFGTAVLAGTVCLVVLMVMGTRLVFVVFAAAAAMPLAQKLVVDVPYRMQRVTTFLDPWQDPRGTGYQLIQSKIAIGSGGLFGVGLGSSVQKAGFLPGADNDFIFSIIAEELGLIGAVAVVALFLLLMGQCLRVVARARDPFAFALSLGLAWLLGMQAAAHVAVVTGSIPTKGLSLPFISAGGSSLVASMLAVGILVNIARSEEVPERHPVTPWHEDVPPYEAPLGRLAQGAWRSMSALVRR